jgi:hypothetical protein
MGDVTLQKRSDLARITLNLPLFSKTSLVPPHVHSIENLFKRPYAVRDCPEIPPASSPYKHPQPPVIYVKTRRKPLVSNKVYLQMGETNYITAEAQRSAEIRREEKQKPGLFFGKGKNNKKEFIKWLRHLCGRRTGPEMWFSGIWMHFSGCRVLFSSGPPPFRAKNLYNANASDSFSG